MAGGPQDRKLRIIRKRDGASVVLQFCPEQYVITTANVFKEFENHDGRAPTLQLVHRSCDELSFDCLIDTTGPEGGDATTLADRIVALAKVEGEQNQPPICDFSWGSILITGRIASVTRTFLLFDADGKPKRIRLGLSVKEYVEPDAQRNTSGPAAPDLTMTVTVKAGDTLASIAARCYGDGASWRPIAEVNGAVVRDPARLAPGLVLEVPRLDLHAGVKP